jgi:hypothetical protein
MVRPNLYAADSAADADRKAQNNDLKEPLFLQVGNLRPHPQFYSPIGARNVSRKSKSP